MSNATSTTLVFALPLLLLMGLVIGPFKRRSVFMALGVPSYILIGLLLIVASGASQMAAGHGSGGSGGWEGWWPLPLWCAIGFPILVVGFFIRPKLSSIHDENSSVEAHFPSLREVAEQNQNAEQADGGNQIQR